MLVRFGFGAMSNLRGDASPSRTMMLRTSRGMGDRREACRT